MQLPMIYADNKVDWKSSVVNEILSQALHLLLSQPSFLLRPIHVGIRLQSKQKYD